MSSKHLSAPLIAIGLLMAAPLSNAHAQGMSDAEIEQAVNLMRSSGQTEAQIQQFLDAVEMAKVAQQRTVPQGANQTDDIQSITGMSDADTAIVGPIAEGIMEQQDQQLDASLQTKIAEFEARYADKPNATATFDGQLIQLKLLDCQLGDAYRFHAQAAPTHYNRAGPIIGGGRGWSVTNQGWAASVSVQIDRGDHYRSDIPAGELIGSTFTYNGPVVSQETGLEKQLSFEATCSE